MPESVVLLHGMLRRAGSMRPLQRALQAQGYRVANLHYPSRAHSIEQHAARLAPIIREWAGGQKVHLVGHSMGGLVIRYLLHQAPPLTVGRIVMLGTPNRGSEIADVLQHWRLYRWLYGPSGQQLTTHYHHAPTLPATAELGIIAGNRPVIGLSARLIGRPSDGTVSIDSTHLPGMRDFVALPAGHSFLPGHPQAIAAVCHFLGHGRFAAT